MSDKVTQLQCYFRNPSYLPWLVVGTYDTLLHNIVKCLVDLLTLNHYTYLPKIK